MSTELLKTCRVFK